MLERLEERVKNGGVGLKAMTRSVKQDGITSAPSHARRYARQGGNLVDVMLTVTVAAVVGYVGLVVMSETEDSAAFNETVARTDSANASEFENASLSLTESIETTFSLVQVAFIVLILTVVVGGLIVLRGR